MKWTIVLLTLLVLATACANQVVDQDETTTATQSATQIIELRLIDGMFEPNTIDVKEGDTVKIQFMNTEPYIFFLEEFGISERVASDYIEFVADKAGSYNFECVDCLEPAIGVLRVI
ncbi:cupredoxin domain-containing protein [archaeon]|nr:cupredoxin domain-containing protein [archaeon]MBL7057176.1 cupredoxin domain-containing protein [Candidatus Woesearchaeota archaeon]